MGEGTSQQALFVPATHSPLPDTFSASDSEPPSRHAVSQSCLPNPTSYSISLMDSLGSLELRIRWLEALTSGAGVYDTTFASKDFGFRVASNGEACRTGLLRRATEVQKQLDQIIEDNDQLKKFMLKYDEYEHVLNPAFAFSPSSPSKPPSLSHGASVTVPSYEELDESELEVLLRDMEPELRTADRDLREIQDLDKSGVTGAGRLAGQEGLRPRLEALIGAHQEDSKMHAHLEERLGSLMQRYSSHVDALSELFVQWNSDVQTAEHTISRIEREASERLRTTF